MKEKKETTKKRSRVQKNATYNTEMIYKTRKEAINFFDDNSSMASEAKK